MLFKFLGGLFLLGAVPFAVKADAAFDAWKQSFATYALEQNVSAQVVQQYVPNLQHLERVIVLDRKQPEFKSPFSAYMKRAISTERIQKGRALFKEKNAVLAKIERRYGVPAPYLLAFWGVETHYGAIKGRINTLDALATLSYDNRRSAFFTQQLIALLKIIQKEQIEPPKGSWAGAFGHFQFMPTTYLQYAVDEDKDGRRDLVNSFDDALGSAANYLSKLGWNPQISWGREAVLPNTGIDSLIDEKMTLKEWYEKGFRLKGKESLTPFEETIQARLIMPAGQLGPAFLVYSNFDVIKRWNRSDFYALSVGILADHIAGKPAFNVSGLLDEAVIPTQDIRHIQNQLKSMGFYEGTPDGIYGSQTRKAVKAYQKQNQMPVDGYLSKDLLEKILK